MTDDEVLPLEIVLRKPIVGIDGEGSTHHFDAIRRRIYVVTDDGERERERGVSEGQPEPSRDERPQTTVGASVFPAS